MKNKTSINNNSIDSAGLPKDYMHAMAELIWNGYDANATNINIVFDTNAIDTINSIEIIDNGDGINFETLSETFGAFLDSQKKNSFQRSSYNKGKKGKGRFSFAIFSGKATWHTVFKQEQNLLEYDIVITRNKKEEYADENKVISKSKNTGTRLILSDLFNVTAASFYCDDFKDFLAMEFGWFLFLNRGNNYTLEINGAPIEFDFLIAENAVENLKIKSENKEDKVFLITYIRWDKPIGDKYYFYFLNKRKREVAKKLTSYNNNALDYHHSVYIESDFFDEFVLREGDFDNDLFADNQNSPVFKALTKYLNELLLKKQKEYVRKNAADKLIVDLEKKGTLPKFSNTKYDRERKKDLISIVKELYCIQPKIFKGLNPQQETTFYWFFECFIRYRRETKYTSNR